MAGDDKSLRKRYVYITTFSREKARTFYVLSFIDIFDFVISFSAVFQNSPLIIKCHCFELFYDVFNIRRNYGEAFSTF